MLNEAGVTVLFGRCLASVAMQDKHIVSATMETGETITADMFIDATYEGDLLAAANVSYHVGREPSATYGESLAGQWQQISWQGVYQFCGRPISPYVVEGNPASGLLPEIMSDPAGNPGDGDHRVQAYNFRMHLSNAADRVPFPKPAGYDPARYGLLARFLNESGITWTLTTTTAANTDGPVQMRNGDSNNAGSFSSDYVGGCNRWPDGTFDPASFSTLPAPRRGLAMPFRQLYELREGIFQDHVRYQMGHLYFLANDPQVPADLRNRVNAWGLRANEFVQTAHWPHQLYVREGRRMVSDYVMTQANCQSTVTASDSVGLASYAMDSHFCQRVVVVEDGVTTVRNEGGFGKSCPQPYPVSYRSIVPKKSECDNLLVSVCLSASHVAYGSIRMEPVFMILGQSAGTAAALAIDQRSGGPGRGLCGSACAVAGRRAETVGLSSPLSEWVELSSYRMTWRGGRGSVLTDAAGSDNVAGMIRTRTTLFLGLLVAWLPGTRVCARRRRRRWRGAVDPAPESGVETDRKSAG